MVHVKKKKILKNKATKYLLECPVQWVYCMSCFSSPSYLSTERFILHSLIPADTVDGSSFSLRNPGEDGKRKPGETLPRVEKWPLSPKVLVASIFAMPSSDFFLVVLGMGKIEGRSRRGRQRMRWLHGITDQWTWVWVDSSSWWWIGRPGVLRFMGSQSRTRLSNWTELSICWIEPCFILWQNKIIKMLILFNK